MDTTGTNIYNDEVVNTIVNRRIWASFFIGSTVFILCAARVLYTGVANAVALFAFMSVVLTIASIIYNNSRETRENIIARGYFTH